MLVNMSEEAHARTRSHEVAPQVARWLDDGLDTADMARRTGLGTTMVRRIGMSLGKFETRRTNVCVGQDVSTIEPTLLGDLARWASGHGLRVMHACITGRPLAKRVFAGGHLCAVTRLVPVNLAPGKESHRLQRPRPDDYDFVLGVLEDGRWMVVPSADVTMPVMSVNVAWKGRFSHYVDAIHQLHGPPRRAMLTTNE